MALAISTSWRLDQPPGSILEELARIEIPALALAPNLSPRSIAQIKGRKWPVLAAWLYAERPEGMPPESDPLQTLPLATPDREMQSRALKQALRSLLLAVELEAPALVVPLLSPKDASPSLGMDAAQRALDPLLEEGMRRRVTIALPLEGEILSEEKALLSLLQGFSGAPLAYWHRGVYQEEEPPPPELPGTSGPLRAPPTEPGSVSLSQSARQSDESYRPVRREALTPRMAQTRAPRRPSGGLVEALTPGGILLLVPPAEPPPPPPEAPLLPPSLAAVSAGASVRLSSLPEGEEPWPEGAWCRKLGAALGERPLVYEPEPARTLAEIEEILSRL